MKKLLVLLMLFALPLHYSWAAVASYCQHESGKAAQHFGHHAHQHQAELPDGEEGTTGTTPFQAHADCGMCHMSCPAAAVPTQSLGIVAPGSFVLADPPSLLSSVIPEGPERPKWARLA